MSFISFLPVFVLFLVPTALWCLYQWLKNREITGIETLIQFVAVSIFGALIIGIGMISSVSDYGVLVGSVKSKDIQTHSCRTYWSDYRSYGCENYSTRRVQDGYEWVGTGEDRRKVPKYKTQYRYHYSWEKDYHVIGTIGSGTTVKRADAQGAQTPKLWSDTEIGDPYAGWYNFDNWVRAAGSSVFNKDAKEIEGLEHPDIEHGFIVTDLGHPDLPREISDTGVLIRFVDVPAGSDPVEYARSVNKTLQGHKLYDVIVVRGPENFTEVQSWAVNDIFNVTLRDHIRANPDDPVSGIRDIIAEHWVAPKDTDFEYLASDLEFPIWVWVLLVILSIGGNIGISAFMSSNEFSKNGVFTSHMGQVRIRPRNHFR